MIVCEDLNHLEVIVRTKFANNGLLKSVRRQIVKYLLKKYNTLYGIHK